MKLDPVKYEVFVRRLFTVLEEGRKAIAMVSGSPAIVEGGEWYGAMSGRCDEWYQGVMSGR